MSGEQPARSEQARRPPAGEGSYYGQPVIKEPVWTPEIPWYFFVGGLGGASATLAAMSGRRHERLARRAWLTSLVALTISPGLLISDLGRPARFLNMLRMFKITSPMSVGSWVLAATGASTGAVCLNVVTRRFGWLARLCRPVAGALGLPVATYTGALIAQTAVPVWHEARRELPALFAAGAATSAGAAAVALAPVDEAAPARRLALVGAIGELALASVMQQRLGELAEPYREGRAGAFHRAARGLTAAGTLLLASAGRRRRSGAVGASALLLGGAACERWSVFTAGFASARDPRYTVEAQRRRMASTSGRGHGASTRARTP